LSSVTDVRVAKRYAGALFIAAQKLNISDQVREDIEVIASLWNEHEGFRQVMESPLISADRKSNLIETVFSQTLQPLSISFMKLLISKRRENLIKAVFDEYGVRVDESEGVIRAHASVVSELTPFQRERLISGLEQRTGSKILLDVHLDPAIIGGVVVRLHDHVIDGSVRGALERIRVKMLSER
jgi:F-type H+-transporting ATPase subunit delta